MKKINIFFICTIKFFNNAIPFQFLFYYVNINFKRYDGGMAKW